MTAKRYHYDPRPQQFDHVILAQVMPDHVFWHFFHYASDCHNKDKWLAKFPKKLDHSIFHGIDESRDSVVWGIHIDEGPNLAVIFVFVTCGLILSGIVGLISGLIMKDVQTAFGVGSYLAAVQTAWMASMYFKWSQE